MNKKALLAALAITLASPLAVSIPAHAQGAQQTVLLIRVDPNSVATGYRASKVIGSSIYNDQNQAIGQIDDIIVSNDGKTPYVIVSAGGFLGMGEHLVALPYDSIRINSDKIILPGGTKDQLKALPEFKYVTK
jgi:sporulation protein YlmC with PRC-barrel domain